MGRRWGAALAFRQTEGRLDRAATAINPNRRAREPGDQPGAAQVLKLTNNILSAVALAATAEAFVMGAKGGLDPEVMIAAVGAGSGRNSAVEDKFPRAVLTRSFDYGAEMHILMKDIDLAIA